VGSLQSGKEVATCTYDKKGSAQDVTEKSPTTQESHTTISSSRGGEKREPRQYRGGEEQKSTWTVLRHRVSARTMGPLIAGTLETEIEKEDPSRAWLKKGKRDATIMVLS